MKSNEILACCVIALGVCGVVAGSLLTEPTAPAAAPAPRTQAPAYAPADAGFTSVQVDDDELPF